MKKRTLLGLAIVLLFLLLLITNIVDAQHYTDWTGFEYTVGDYDSKGRVVYYELVKDYTISLPEYFYDESKIPAQIPVTLPLPAPPLPDGSHHSADFYHSWAKNLPTADWDFIKLEPGGILTVKKGYRWDGASLPCKKYDKNYCPDQHHNFRSTLIHDAIYDLMRMGYLEPDTRHLPNIGCVADDPSWSDTTGDRNRQMADMLIYMIAMEDGQAPGGGKGEAWYDYFWIRIWGGIRTHCDKMLEGWKYHVSELTAYPSNGKVELRWEIADKAGKDPNSSDHFSTHNGYNILRNGVSISKVSLNTTTYTDLTAVNGEIYVYSLEPDIDNTNQYDFSNQDIVSPRRGPGSAISLDGVNDFVSLNYAANDFSSTGVKPEAITLETWVYPEAQVGYQGILNFQQATGFTGLVYYAAKQRFCYYDDVLDNFECSIDQFSPETWHHVAVTVNANNEAVLYVNGTQQTAFTVTMRPLKGAEFSIGSLKPGKYYFDGLIDETRVWNVARTQDQIQTSLCTPLMGYEPGLVGLWHFDIGLNTVYDATSNANDGTIHGKSSDPLVPSGAMITQARAQDITAQLDASGTVSITPADVDAGTPDTCGIQSTSVSPNTFTCQHVGTNPVTLTVADNNGNITTASAVVTVVDLFKPTVLTHDITVELDESGSASILPAQVDAGSTDNCGIQTTAVSPNSFTCQEIGTNMVTLTATDIHGNTAFANAAVNIVDRLPPAISEIVTSHQDLWPPNNKLVPVEILEAAVLDNCGALPLNSCRIISVDSSEAIIHPDSGSPKPDYKITADLTVALRAQRTGKGAGRTYTITIECTDASGNASRAAAEVLVPSDQRKK